jgi:osmoprotectant transport system permease protein
MDALLTALRWLTDPVNYSGQNGIPTRLIEHVQVSVQPVLLALSLALPVGMYIGHRRRFEFLAISIGNFGRAIPSFGILAVATVLTYSWPGELGYWPIFVALFFLAIPPILTNTYVGVKGVDRDVVEAARGMGMTESELLLRVELPLATPLIITGLRTAAVQVVATATLGAIGGFGGLGRYIIDGFSTGDETEILGGAILVALLAIATELCMGALERVLAPRVSSARARNLLRPTAPKDVVPADLTLPRAGQGL